MDYLLKFNSEESSPSTYMIIIYTLAIIIASNLFFILICALFGTDPNTALDNEKNDEYKAWKEKGLSIWALIGTELFSNTIYSPLAEELAFKFLLLKVLLVERLQLHPDCANIVQGLIFGLLHLANMSTTLQTKVYTQLQTISAIISGIVSGWVYVHSNSIIPSILAHVLNNGAAGVSEIIGYIKYLKHNK